MRSKGSRKTVRRTLADGSVKEYVYPRRKPRRHKAPTLGDAITAYKSSADWRKLSPNSQATFNFAIEHVRELTDQKVASIRRRDVLDLRDVMSDRPGTCNVLIGFLSILFNWMIDREWVETNPAQRIKKLPSTPHKRWDWRHVEMVALNFPPPLVRAVMLCLYTGPRRGDLVRIKWDDYDGSTIWMIQEKTGVELEIPVHRDLRAMLATWPREAETILTNSFGRPWDGRSLSRGFFEIRRQYPELAGLTIHGLRNTAASCLAEAGCTTNEIAAITGHKTLAMIDHYTRQADQRRRAQAAVMKMENAENTVISLWNRKQVV